VPALVVRDRGRGFTPQLQLPDVLAESGRGLFLIEYHGGQLFVMPRHGGGSDVMVLLPILVEPGVKPVA
jgi:signal transduction histidine kinase